MAALRTAILGQREPGSLCAAARADVDLLQHQLEPALAVVRHGARRLLLADAVGLGKTIEAGLVLIELRARSALDRVLLLAPPGLCNQWCAELEADSPWSPSSPTPAGSAASGRSCRRQLIPGPSRASTWRPSISPSVPRSAAASNACRGTPSSSTRPISRQATANAVRPQTLLPPGPASCCCSPPRRTAGIIGPFMRSAASARWLQ